MVDSTEVLIKLIRLALGNESCGSLPLSVDWREVIDLSFEQGVAAIAVDGLQRIYDSLELRDESLETLDSPELEDLKYEWFGEVMNAEQEYGIRVGLVERLRGLGVPLKVLKGVAFAGYYPIAAHRNSGDIDVYCPGGAFEALNKAVEARGIGVDRRIRLHSQFSVDGVLVENHRYLVDDERMNAELLEVMAEDEALFDALFCLLHARKHFLTEGGIQLRHVCDWAMIRQKVALGDAVERFGLGKFCRPLDEVADLLLGQKTQEQLSTAARRMLEDIFAFGSDCADAKPAAPKSMFRRRLAMASGILRSGWKFRMFGDVPMLPYLLRSVWRHFTVKN